MGLFEASLVVVLVLFGAVGGVVAMAVLAPKNPTRTSPSRRRTYKMHDGVVVDTRTATGKWLEAGEYDSPKHGVINGSPRHHETLYRSRKGRYWIESTSHGQNGGRSARFVTNGQAAAWLLANGHTLPGDLRAPVVPLRRRM